MAGKVSMRHVAHRAGVSVQTVSRVLNEPHLVSPDTRERVEAAIAALGYQRDEGARALRTQRSGLVGFMVHGTSVSGPSSAVARMSEAARLAGLSSIVMAVRPTDPVSSRAALDALLGRHVEGIVAIAAQAWAADAAVELARRLPVVLACSRPAPPEIPRVAVDQTRAVELVVEHFDALGLTDALHVQGPMAWFDAQQRSEAWVRIMGERGVEPRIVPAGFLASEGYEAGRRIVGGRVPRAVFAVNDYSAYGVMRALHEAGLRVPTDVAVAGVDDGFVDPFTVPSLTSVRQPLDVLADAAVDLLVEAIAGRPPRTVMIEPELRVRESSTPSG